MLAIELFLLHACYGLITVSVMSSKHLVTIAITSHRAGGADTFASVCFMNLLF